MHQHPDQLAGEERVAFSGGEHPSGHRRWQLAGADHVGGEPGRGAGIEPAERDDVVDEATGSRQRRARVAQLGPRRHQDEQRHVGRPRHEVLGEVEQ